MVFPCLVGVTVPAHFLQPSPHSSDSQHLFLGGVGTPYLSTVPKTVLWPMNAEDEPKESLNRALVLPPLFRTLSGSPQN